MAKRGNPVNIVNRRPNSRKSQITAFILIGIVVFAIFGLMLAASSSMKRLQVEKQIDIAAEKIAETNILKQYVTLCLKDSLGQGLTIAGKQGGIIGLPDNYIEYEGYNLSYGIKSRLDRLAPISSGSELPGPPDYPCISSPGTSSYPCGPTPYNELIGAGLKIYPFGEKNLPAFCDPEGPNAANLNLFPFPCPIGTYGADSIQAQLNSFIAAKLEECVKLDPIEKITDLKITAGTPNVSVLFGEDEVTAMATYPLNMSLGKYTSTRFFDFHANLPVRIKKVFGLADFLAKNDIYYISFNTTKDYIKYKYFGKDILPAMNVNRYRISENPKADVVEINDTISIIGGKPYIFRFAVQNRIPALEPVQDIGVEEGQAISINAKAYDPDDNDRLVYSVEGWKQGFWSVSGGLLGYTTQEGDSGSHAITVKACDEAGSCDWQDINIKVHSITQ